MDWTDLDAECDRSRAGTGPISVRSSTDLAEEEEGNELITVRLFGHPSDAPGPTVSLGTLSTRVDNGSPQ